MTLTLPSEPAAEAVLSKMLNDPNLGKEKYLTQLLSNNGITIGDSLERIALMSLFYNSNGGTLHNNIIGPALLTALQSGNRADAWYQIRYKTNPNSLSANPPADAQGMANRRYMESSEFGLYDPGTVTPQEALAVYQMYTQHAPDMIQYDNLYGGAQYGTAAALQPAATVLDGLYGRGQIFDPLNIFAAGAAPSAPYNGNYLNRSSDTGADLIIGGAGNGTVIGGSGSDTFVYLPPATGATTETIDDTLGKGKGSVYVGSNLLTTANDAEWRMAA